MRKKGLDWILFAALGYPSIVVVAVICLIPFVFIVTGSLSSEYAIFKYGYGFMPREFTLEAYRFIFSKPETIVKAYTVTILLTAIGTALSLYLVAMTGYVLNKKEFRSRNAFSLYFYFTTLFSGGLVPWYLLMTKYLHMKNNYLSLLLPLLYSVFYIIIMRSFMSSIPDAVMESAKIDGADEFYIFMKIVLPLSKPALATIGMFTALRFWNDWYNAMLFITNKKMYPMQYLLYILLNSAEEAKRMAGVSQTATEQLPAETFKLAMTVVAAGPIVFLFPFIQKYFIRGMTVGAVKG